jgi:hypothetical protein
VAKLFSRCQDFERTLAVDYEMELVIWNTSGREYFLKFSPIFIFSKEIAASRVIFAELPLFSVMSPKD